MWEAIKQFYVNNIYEPIAHGKVSHIQLIHNEGDVQAREAAFEFRQGMSKSDSDITVGIDISDTGKVIFSPNEPQEEVVTFTPGMVVVVFEHVGGWFSKPHFTTASLIPIKEP